ncbi:MAG: divergent polysaccharide deacetylase family protein, partial [Candidatus Omnitrophota bacterium]
EGPGGTAYFEVAYKGSAVLALTLENALPDWLKEDTEVEKSFPAIALVLDDFGYTKRNLKLLKAIREPVTIAILPNAPYSGAVSSFAEENGIETILHLPMEPEGDSARLEKETIMVGMDDDGIDEIIARALKVVPSASGVSNHQGSKATRDEKTMKRVLGELKEKDLFFLDSMTTSESVCGTIAEKKGILYAKRDLFLDRRSDKDYIKGQLEKAERIARKNGRVVVIGHDRAKTLRVLREVIPEMRERGIKFVKLSEIIEKNADTRY